VTEHAISIFSDEDGLLTEYGLMGMLFGMLDTESDMEMIRNIHDTITSMLQMLAADNLSQWLSMCKRVLSVATESELAAIGGGLGEVPKDNDGDDDDDNAEFHTDEPKETHPALENTSFCCRVRQENYQHL
jgi:HEAT repeat-containing protein 5